MKLRVLLLTLCTATNIWAQSNNQSDVTGPTVTTSDIAANAFTPPSSAATVTFVSPTVAASVATTITTMQASLARASFSSATIPTQTQTALATLLSCSGGCGAAAQQITTGLMSTASGAPPMERAVALTEAMRGLGSAASTGNHQRVAQQLQRAATAFRELISGAGEQYLLNPPAELIATHAVLSAAIGNK